MLERRRGNFILSTILDYIRKPHQPTNSKARFIKPKTGKLSSALVGQYQKKFVLSESLHETCNFPERE